MSQALGLCAEVPNCSPISFSEPYDFVMLLLLKLGYRTLLGGGMSGTRITDHTVLSQNLRDEAHGATNASQPYDTNVIVSKVQPICVAQGKSKTGASWRLFTHGNNKDARFCLQVSGKANTFLLLPSGLNLSEASQEAALHASKKTSSRDSANPIRVALFPVKTKKPNPDDAGEVLLTAKPIDPTKLNDPKPYESTNSDAEIRAEKIVEKTRLEEHHKAQETDRKLAQLANGPTIELIRWAQSNIPGWLNLAREAVLKAQPQTIAKFANELRSLGVISQRELEKILRGKPI